MYMLSTAQNFLLRPDFDRTQTEKVKASLASNASAGYRIESDDRLLYEYNRNFRNCDTAATVWHNANLSVNYNLFSSTAVLATQTVTLPSGTFTFGFVSGAGSITSNNGTGVATAHGTATAVVNNTIVVTTPGTFTFTVAGVVNQAQLNVGSTLREYRARIDATAINSLNLSTSPNGNAIFQNGNPANMLADDDTADLAYFFNNSLAQDFRSNRTWNVSEFTAMTWLIRSGGGRGIFGGSTTSGGVEIRIASTGRIELVKRAVTLIATGVSVVTELQWQHVAVTWKNGTFAIFLNGVLDVTGGSAQTFNVNNIVWGSSGGGSYMNGSMNDVIVCDKGLVSSQISKIYNFQKSYYGIS